MYINIYEYQMLSLFIPVKFYVSISTKLFSGMAWPVGLRSGTVKKWYQSTKTKI
jgi:hypothetical protein